MNVRTDDLRIRDIRELTTPESMIGAMVNVLLPERFEATDDNAERVRNALDEAGFEELLASGRSGE